MKTSLIAVTALCSALTGFSAASLLAQAPDNPAPAPAVPAQDAKAPRLSAGLNDIVKLTKARVDESVILAYVQGSRVAYHPSAQEIIRLREAGVSSSVITAMVQRGAEIRQQTAEAAKAAKAAKPAAPAPSVAPQPPDPTPVAPATSSPTVFVAPSSYSAAPSTVIYTGYGYPTYSYPFGGYGYYGYGGCYYPRSYGWYGYSSCYPRYYGHGPYASFAVRVGGGYGGWGPHGGVHYGGAHFGGGHFGRAPMGGAHSAGFHGGFRH